MDDFVTRLNLITNSPMFLWLSGFALAMLVVLLVLQNITPPQKDDDNSPKNLGCVGSGRWAGSSCP
ncbi:MAG: hypothetical protein GY945_04525, partial [Rhodobacteraceae bacterium]|nr:hypothetical protein [Paracoccaceae bacterium]